MKNFNSQYKAKGFGKPTIDFWFYFFRWLRLMAHALTQVRKNIPEFFVHDHAEQEMKILTVNVNKKNLEDQQLIFGSIYSDG